ncbi:MAG: FtsK/SpoIIIE domain-containing protein [Candidatus Dormibacteria bacterium]
MRFFAGRELNGVQKTDRTFLARGTKLLHPHARKPKRWSYWPEWIILSIRLNVLIFLVGCVWSLTITLTATGSMLFVVTGLKSKKLVNGFLLDRNIATPLWEALLAHGIRFPGDTRIDDWLTLPTNYRTDKKAHVKLKLPTYWSGDAKEKETLFRLVSRKIGGQWDAHWQDSGQPFLDLTHKPEPPKFVSFLESLKYIKRLKDGQLFVGLGSRGEPIVIDLDKECPHVLITCGTGGGKTATLAFLIVQILAWGAHVFGIDPKRISLNCTKDLPGITIIRDIEAQWDEIARFRAEMERRYKILDDDPATVFPRWVLVMEESNTFHIDSVDYWEDIRQRGDPAKPRVYRDINAILNKGRQCHMNVLSVFQRAEAAVTGGGTARSQYGTFLMARYKKPEWKMFVDLWPWLAPSKVHGRMAIYDGDSYRYVQVGCVFDLAIETPTLVPEAVDYVLSTRPASVPVPRLPSTGRTDGTELVNESSTPITLRDACEGPDAILSTTLTNAQRAVSRDKTFPKDVGKQGQALVYSRATLLLWEEQRNANQPRRKVTT